MAGRRGVGGLTVRLWRPDGGGGKTRQSSFGFGPKRGLASSYLLFSIRRCGRCPGIGTLRVLPVLGKDVFAVTVYPQVDFAFIVAVVVVLHEIEINQDGKGED
ncbi:hypothetical protein ACLB2K_064242 [Fragaria x ananassa]